MSEKQNIGFIGTGVMGRSMAGHLLAAGHSLHVYNRTKAKAQELIDKGATWYDTVGGVSASAEVTFTIVGFPKDVESVYLGKDGVIANAKPGSVVVDMTTSSPDLAKKIYEIAKEKGVASLDVPVSGGDIGAREGRLSIMVGGDAEAYERVRSLLELMGKNIVLQGGAGSGQYTKMCNQIAVASTMLAVCESMAYAKAAGLDPSTVLKSIESGAAGSWALSNLAPRLLNEDFAPGFYIKHFIKDMRIAIESAEQMELKLPGLTLAKTLYEQLAEMGKGDLGTQALFQLYSME